MSLAEGRVTPRYATLLSDRPTASHTRTGQGAPQIQIQSILKKKPPPLLPTIMSRVAVSLANATLRLRIRVRPNAAETRVIAVREERVDIAVTEPARDGMAGRGVVAFVSKVCMCVCVMRVVGLG